MVETHRWGVMNIAGYPATVLISLVDRTVWASLRDWPYEAKLKAKVQPRGRHDSPTTASTSRRNSHRAYLPKDHETPYDEDGTPLVATQARTNHQITSLIAVQQDEAAC